MVLVSLLCFSGCILFVMSMLKEVVQMGGAVGKNGTGI
jgi:hypothetical protein